MSCVTILSMKLVCLYPLVRFAAESTLSNFVLAAEAEVARLKQQLQFEKDAAILKAKQELEASRAARVRQLEQDIQRAKEAAHRAVTYVLRVYCFSIFCDCD
jgi:hypothetical protein